MEILNRIFLKKLRKFFGDLVSFRTPLSRIIIFSFIILFFFFLPFGSIEELPTKCVFKNVIFPFLFNGDCPDSGLFKDCECLGCGMTRALSELLDGNFKKAAEYNPLVFPLVFVILFIIIKDIIILFKNYKIKFKLSEEQLSRR